MDLTPYQLFLANLKQEIPSHQRGYMTREEAYRALKKVSGQDFGLDIEAWREWCDQQEQKDREAIENAVGEHNFQTWEEIEEWDREERKKAHNIEQHDNS